MILYVNGDSHTAAAEAVNPYAFCEDDPRYNYLHRLPHPENLEVSWGRRLSTVLRSTFKCDAESAASNARIMRTTREWISKNTHHLPRVFMIIQWSTWEREEWVIDGEYYQVNASGVDVVPMDYRRRYRDWISQIDWPTVRNKAHQDIWDFHQELSDLGIKHIFFNGNNHFGDIQEKDRKDWGISYVGPYDPNLTYNQWLLDHGFETVSPKSWHFGEDAHGAWSRFMLQYIVANKLV